MYCPGCGSEERQLSQYCRACGTDLRVVRAGLDKLDANAAAAMSARDQIGRALAEKIRETESTSDLKKIAEDVLPQLEKFFETQQEKRLRRTRSGVIFAAIGLGLSIISLLLTIQDPEFVPLLLPGFVFFFVGLGIVLNGIFFTVPKREDDSGQRGATQFKSGSGQMQAELAPAAIQPPTTNDLEAIPLRTSVTEHTTHHLK